MQSHWTNNPDARNRVAEILRHAGIPLELRVAGECELFCKDRNPPKTSHLRTCKLVYSPLDDHNCYREVDQLVTIYEEFPISKQTGIQLIGSIPIECKYRHGIEYFAFHLGGNHAHEGFPVWSSLAGSQLFRSLRPTYSTLRDFPPALASMVEIRDGKTPSTLFKENIIHNSIGSLYDYALHEVGSAPIIEGIFEDSELKKVRHFAAFQRYIQKNNYAWWSVLRDQIEAIPLEACRRFNRVLSRSRAFYGIHFALPVICVNGPIYSVASNQSFEITDYKEIESCLISIRKQSWPGHARFALLKRTAEVPAVLTTPKGLRKVLEAALRWHSEIRNVLVNTDSTLLERWQLEAALYSMVLTHYQKKDPLLSYRSDIDIDEYL